MKKTMRDLEKMIPIVAGAGMSIMLYKQWLKENMILVLNNRVEKRRRKFKRIRKKMDMNWEIEEMKVQQRISELVALRKQLRKEFDGWLQSKKQKPLKKHTAKKK